MERTELESLVELYEGGYADIQAILDDDELSSADKLDAIDDVVFGGSSADEVDAEDE